MLRSISILIFYTPLILCENDEPEIAEYWQLGDILFGLEIFFKGKVSIIYRLL